MKSTPYPPNQDASASSASQNDLYMIVSLADKDMRKHGYVTGAQMRHYKGGVYRYQGITLREEDLSPQVLYSNSQGIMFNRPLSQFLNDIVETGTGLKTPRFVPYKTPRMQSIFDAFDVREPE